MAVELIQTRNAHPFWGALVSAAQRALVETPAEEKTRLIREADQRERTNMEKTEKRSQWMTIIRKDINTHTLEGTTVPEKDALVTASIESIARLFAELDEEQHVAVFETLQTLFARESVALPEDPALIKILDTYLHVGQKNFVVKQGGKEPRYVLQKTMVRPIVLLSYLKESEARFKHAKKSLTRRSTQEIKIAKRIQKSDALEKLPLDDAVGLARNAFHLLDATAQRDIHTAFYKLVNQPPHHLVFADLPSDATHFTESLRRCLVAFSLEQNIPMHFSKERVVALGGEETYQVIARFLNRIDSQMRNADTMFFGRLGKHRGIRQ